MKWDLQILGTCSSTQDIVIEHADQGAEEGFAVQALTQNTPRGRHGNQWDAPMGNLYLSFLLRPDCTLNEAGQLAFVMAVALSEAVDIYMKDGPVKTLKWPNDVLIDGQKIAGILLENQLRVDGTLEYLVVGLGVNILSPPEGRAGLQEISDRRVAINVFRDDFLACFGASYKDWQEKGFAPIRQKWLKQAHGLGQPIRIRLPETQYEGVFKGLDETGVLEAQIDGTVKRFTAGEVHFST